MGLRSLLLGATILAVSLSGCASEPPEPSPAQTATTGFDPDSTCGSIGCARDCSDQQPCWFTYGVRNEGTTRIRGFANITFDPAVTAKRSIGFHELETGREATQKFRMSPANATVTMWVVDGDRERSSNETLALDWWKPAGTWSVNETSIAFGVGVV